MDPAEKEKLSPVKRAVHEASENVSMAGLQEAVKDEFVPIRVMFTVTLAVLVGCSAYYTYGLVVEWNRSGYATDIKDINDIGSMPFTNITVCADVNINETHVKQNITVPVQLAELVEKVTRYTKTEFMAYFVKWITTTTLPRHIPPSLVSFFRMLLAANPQTSSFTDFLRSSFTPCRSMLQNCKLDGIPLDCSSKHKSILDEGTLCYQIVMSHDTNSLDKSSRTRRQVETGAKHGLTFEARMNLQDILWLDEDMSGGFKVFLNPAPFPAIQTPLVAPSAAETFIKIISTEKVLSEGCLRGYLWVVTTTRTGICAQWGNSIGWFTPECSVMDHTLKWK